MTRLSLSVFSAFVVVSCSTYEPPTPECSVDADCADEDICVDDECVAAPVQACEDQPGWTCVDETLTCVTPLAGACDVTDELVDEEACVDDDTVDNAPVAVVCVEACGGELQGARCIEDAPSEGRRQACSEGTFDVATCACTDKCDCAPGEICGADGCAPAPPTCGSASADCGRGPVIDGVDQCEAFLCNGFTNTCFTSVPIACRINSDCDVVPGCADAACPCTDGICVIP